MSGDHSHDHRASSRRRLAVAFGIALVVFVLQAVGGLLTGSLALLADAGHVLTDAAGVGLALFAGQYAWRRWRTPGGAAARAALPPLSNYPLRRVARVAKKGLKQKIAIDVI